MFPIFQKKFSEEIFNEMCKALEEGDTAQVSLGTDPYALSASEQYYYAAQQKYGDSILYNRDPMNPFQYQLRLSREGSV